jgi:hypothetical protein
MADSSENSAKDQSAPVAAFAETCERLAATASRLERTRLVADYLAGLAAGEARWAARFLVGRAFAEREGRRLSVSGRTVVQALRALGLDPDARSWTGVADFGELVRRLFADGSFGRAAGEGRSALSLADLDATFRRIAAAQGGGSRAERIDLLAGLFRRATARSSCARKSSSRCSSTTSSKARVTPAGWRCASPASRASATTRRPARRTRSARCGPFSRSSAAAFPDRV